MAIHILQFFSTLQNGGAENRMMDVYRLLDPAVVAFDFAVLHEGEHFFDEEIRKGGSEKYVLPDPRKGLLKNYLALRTFFARHPFQAVHTHVSWYGGVVLAAAKHAGIAHRIAHARSAEDPHMSGKKKLARAFGRVLFRRCATERFAISEAAARNTFGAKAVERGACRVIPNAIDRTRYRVLDGEERLRLRESLGIPAGWRAYVTVANLRRVKNHGFLLRVAEALRADGEDFVLCLIGDGALRKEIETQIREKGLEEQVRLLGSRGDVPQILCAFDGMIFPSLYEGLGTVALEAQITGLPAVVSTAVPPEADLGIGMLHALSPELPPAAWAQAVSQLRRPPDWTADGALRALREKGYCLEDTAAAYLRAYGLEEETVKRAVIQRT